ncbi:MAG: DUF1080 domain-containing protein [Planctomycetales bacterium]
MNHRLLLVGLCLGLSCGLVFRAPQAVSARENTGSQNHLMPEEISEGWIQLFDGESLFGWKGTPGIDWRVEEGEIRAEKGPIGGLFTNMEFANYELKCDFKIDATTNSAVFVHSIFDPQNPVKECYEVNLCDQHPKFKTGGIVGIAPPQHFVPGAGGWKQMHLTVRGPKVQVKIDRELVLDFEGKGDQARHVGLIGLQKNVGAVAFRNIFLKPLDQKQLFNGKDLTGWHLTPGGKSTFTAEEGAIHVKNGRGYLESDGTWKDFILQAEIFSNGEHLNSGIFFRSIKATEKLPAEGYEAQVRNEWKGSDRTKPVDFGTGAIYRRIATRKVVSSDFEWFTMTVAARVRRSASG